MVINKFFGAVFWEFIWSLKQRNCLLGCQGSKQILCQNLRLSIVQHQTIFIFLRLFHIKILTKLLATGIRQCYEKQGDLILTINLEIAIEN